MHRFFCFVVLCLAAVSNTRAQPTGDAARAAFEQFIQAEMKTTRVPGLAVAVIRDDRVVFTQGFGVASVETNAHVTGDTLFQIGSLTKPFTAAAVLALAAKGAVKLDQPVGAYIIGLHPQIARLTLHHLLSHTSGMQDEPAEYGAQDEAALGAYQRTWQPSQLFLAPGQSFSYSNAGFSLAGLAAQEAAGKPFADLMTELIFGPLGMTHATFRPTVAMTYPLAIGHKVAGDKTSVVRPLPNDTRFWPAGTFYTSANELARFARAFLNGGKLDGKVALPAEVFAQMSRAAVDVPGMPDEAQYGYGLFLTRRRGLAELGHEGSMTGYSAMWRAYPSLGLAIVVLANKDSQRLTGYADKLLDLYAPTATAAAPAPKPALAMTVDELRRYVGKYAAPNRFTVEVVEQDSKLVLKQFNQKIPLTKVGPGRFAIAQSIAREIAFGLDAAGAPLFLQQFYWTFKKMP